MKIRLGGAGRFGGSQQWFVTLSPFLHFGEIASRRERERKNFSNHIRILKNILKEFGFLLGAGFFNIDMLGCLYGDCRRMPYSA